MTLPAYNEQTLADAVAQKTAERILMSQAADSTARAPVGSAASNQT